MSNHAQQAALKCFCCCPNETGCLSALRYCSGHRFMLANVALTVPAISKAYTYTASSWKSVKDDALALTPPSYVPFNEWDGYTVFLPMDSGAFTTDVSWTLTIGSPPSTYVQWEEDSYYKNGIYRKITAGAETFEFDSLDGMGVATTVSTALRARPAGDSSGASTQTVSGTTYTKTWTAAETKSADELIEWIDVTYSCLTSIAGDQASVVITVNGRIEKWIRATGDLTIDWSVDTSSSHVSDGTIEYGGKSIVNILGVFGTGFGDMRGSQLSVNLCEGTAASWTHTGTMKVYGEANNVQVTSVSPLDHLHYESGASYTYTTGTAVTSLGSGTSTRKTTFTNSEVGCRSCPRALHIVFTRSVARKISTKEILALPETWPDEDKELVTQTWEGDLFQLPVDKCEVYACSWSGSVDVSEPDTTPVPTSMTLKRLGKNLWSLATYIIFKVAADCPTGGALTVLQGLNPHRYVAPVYTTGTPSNTSADWSDPEYEITYPFTTHISDYTLAVTASSATNPNSYHCDEPAPLMGRAATMTAPAEEDNTVLICDWRVAENYTQQGRAILLAGRVEEVDGKWRVTREAWEAAQAHRS